MCCRFQSRDLRMAVWAKKMVAKKAGLYMEEWLTGYRWGRGRLYTPIPWHGPTVQYKPVLTPVVSGRSCTCSVA